jgi:hypothetical protein
VRERDPRLVLQRRRQARARVKIVKVPQPPPAEDGSVTSRQEAEVTLPRSEAERIWNPEYLERLGRTYWLFLGRISLGLLRVLYGPDSREVVFLTRPFVLLRFRKPSYEYDDEGGTVTWPIDGGLLVAPSGRGKGYLRLSVRRLTGQNSGSDEATGRVSSDVANFYPTIAGWGWFAKIGRFIYRLTQLRIHVLVTHAFLRSLANLQLDPSVVGALRPPTPASPPRSPAASPDRGGR